MSSPVLPPQDVESEASCLAAVLLSRDALMKVLELLRPADFYLTQHQIIFEAIVDLEKKNLPVDLITLKQRLTDKGMLDKIGGDGFLAELYRIVATSANAEYYARRVKDLSLRRQLISVTAAITEKCYNPVNDTYELMDEAERAIFDVTERRISSDFREIEEIVDSTLGTIEKMFREKRAVTGTPTGFTELDELLTGLHAAELLILAARPSVGKTALALNMLNHIVLKEKKPALFFSLEMPAEQLASRLLCIESLVDSQKVRVGHISSDELQKLITAGEKLKNAPVYIDDTPAITIFEIRAKARRLAQKEPLGLIVVDYLQLISSDSRADRQNQISEISRGLKMIARELSVPVLALSQLSRAVESRTDQRPQLSDLRESGAIEQDADVVMFIYREDRVKKDPTPEKKGVAEIMIAKQRNGPIGNIELMFWDKYTKFASLDRVHNYDETVPEYGRTE